MRDDRIRQYVIAEATKELSAISRKRKDKKYEKSRRRADFAGGGAVSSRLTQGFTEEVYRGKDAKRQRRIAINNEDLGSKDDKKQNDNSLASMHLNVCASKIGFTLAEVLITLGIIGVVAALTLPTLIQNYRKNQTVTQLKKAYSELSQALNLAQKDNGTFESWDFADFETPAERTQYFYDNYLAQNLKILKSCVQMSSSECWVDDVKDIRGTLYTGASNEISGRSSFITASGYSIYFWVHGVGNGGWFFIDINGKKQPNVLGKDVFVFTAGWGNCEKVYPSPSNHYYTKTGLYASGLEKKGLNSTRETLLDACKQGDSDQCAGLIVFDGWEIAPDYPW